MTARRQRRFAIPAFLAAATLAGSGCALNETDGWLWDLSVVGRWEHTPTVVPVLDRIDVVEADSGDFVDVTPVQPDDLLPEPNPYRIGPGDGMIIVIEDIIAPGRPEGYERVVDAQGYIEIPQLGRILAAGRTQPELQLLIEQAIIDAGIDTSPLVNLQIPGQRGTTFSVFGAIQNPARYSIPYPEYRLLEALTDAGGLSPLIQKVFVIRQVPLSDSVTQGVQSSMPANELARPRTTPRGAGQEAEDLNKLIQDLTEPPPGALRSDPGFSAFSDVEQGRTSSTRHAVQLAELDDSAPLIDLDDSGVSTPSANANTAPPTPVVAAGQWVFIEGRWLQVMASSATTSGSGLPEGPDPLAAGSGDDQLVTQRVIEVPSGPLLQGMARYNIVIRPGDIIHVPPPDQGVVYAMGPGIQRPGTYNLPQNGRLTLTRLVAAAGGFSQIATPERVDLTRVVGDRGQATIRLNARAIFEGTHPDVRLKSDDMLNFGTNFFATPMAVIRNGFRMSYGFGFLVDRNFGNDIFGAPPTRIEGN
jgi:polysaccharide export outer membrane protein